MKSARVPCFCLSICILSLMQTSCTKPGENESNAVSRRVITSAAGEAGHYAIHVSTDDFEQIVLKSDLPVLVDFWATWCPPCVKLGPTIEEIAAAYKGKAVVCKLNIDLAGEIANEYEISSIPALLFFKDGKVVDTIVGLSERETIEEKLEQLF